MRVLECDYLVVGSGMAGLSAALYLSRLGKVIVATKKEAWACNTNYAQGGIACVVLKEDSFEKHVADTLDAGAGLCDEAVVRRIVSDGPARMEDLRRWGIHFTERDDGVEGYDLGREGGHSERRILHSGDITGRHVEERLLEAVAKEANITLLEHTMAIDLVTSGRLGFRGPNRCIGSYMLDRQTGDIFAIHAPHTILATGGVGKVYLYTCNPDVATGGGIAIGWRAGARVRNMEFIQFHPTCLYHPQAKNFLISEAVRGEGAQLVDAEGNPFMHKYDPRGALAPRDIVARAIDHEMKTRGLPCMYLDIRHKGYDFLVKRFPNIYAKCLSFGIDMAKDLIPIVPATHYCCGGLDATVEGETSLPGLFAVGEVACTGLHGANRLASNSLLEAIVMAHALSERLEKTPVPEGFAATHIPPWHLGEAVPSDEAVVVAHNWAEVRTCMWDYVGIVRTNKRLERAAHRIRNLRHEIRQYYFDYLVTADMLELRNIADVAALIVDSAIRRHESRGLHTTRDYPELLSEARDTILEGRTPCEL